MKNQKSSESLREVAVDTRPEGLLVVELFAGIGGFRLGLEKAGHKVIWSNQWEPATKKQDASECYVAHFGAEGHSNEDICKVHLDDIPEHDLLVGGFPCQDYSVAATKAEGICGKKGVLWWEIHRILKAKRPPYVLLENVDRLLKSPSSQRGRDFGIMLACFRDLVDNIGTGYSVEWRVINAADYGFAQRRRRIFILAFRDDTPIGEQLRNTTDWHSWLLEEGFFAGEFPVTCQSKVLPIPGIEISYSLEGSLVELSDRFRYPFQDAGIMSRGRLYTTRVEPLKEPFTPLSAILEEDVPEDFYIPEESIDEWSYAKGAKSEPRRTKDGYEYCYTEGAIPFPDDLSRPARTILTSEGTRSPNRCSHIIKDPRTHRYRRLTPIEVERICGFPDGWTDTGMSLYRRYFCLGNSLVVGLVERMGKRLGEMIAMGKRDKDKIGKVNRPGFTRDSVA